MGGKRKISMDLWTEWETVFLSIQPRESSEKKNRGVRCVISTWPYALDGRPRTTGLFEIEAADSFAVFLLSHFPGI